MISVIVVATDEVSGGALAAALGASPDIGECDQVQPTDAEKLATSNIGETVIVDMAPPDTERTTSLALISPVLVLGSGQADEMVSAVEAGAMGYLDSTASFDQISEAVASLAKGTATVEPTLLGALLRHVVDRRRLEREALKELEVLTPRQEEVFRLLARGLDNDEVGNRLFISPQTVRTHTRSIMTKLDLHSRSDLVALAARCGLDLSPNLGEDG